MLACTFHPVLYVAFFKIVTTKEPSAATPKSPERNPGDRDGKELLEKLVVEYFLTKDGIALPPIPLNQVGRGGIPPPKGWIGGFAIKEFPTALSRSRTLQRDAGNRGHWRDRWLPGALCASQSPNTHDQRYKQLT